MIFRQLWRSNDNIISLETLRNVSVEKLRSASVEKLRNVSVWIMTNLQRNKYQIIMRDFTISRGIESSLHNKSCFQH